MTAPLRVGLAGLGTVGAAVAKLLLERRDLLAARCGRPIWLAAVSARDRGKGRGVALDGVEWVDNAAELADRGVDVAVEAIGGEDGPALALARRALDRGVDLVTANKALIARHGTELARRAEASGAGLGFEAAVAGGIPIIKALREGLAAARPLRVYGILNGTCNYILTDMREAGRSFDAALAKAQALGYAEADPAFDIDGIDAAHKLTVLASLAFGTRVDFDAVHVEGIRGLAPEDIAHAEELGYRIKLLGVAERRADGLMQRVHPCMVPRAAPIAAVEGVLNAVVCDAGEAGTTVYEGPGAGAGPTAAAVAADIADAARGRRGPAFSVPADALEEAPAAPLGRRWGAWYVRLSVADRPGVIADVAARLRDRSVSIEALVQRARGAGPVPVVMTTHETDEASMGAALADIGALGAVAAPPRSIRIETL